MRTILCIVTPCILDDSEETQAVIEFMFTHVQPWCWLRLAQETLTRISHPEAGYKWDSARKLHSLFSQSWKPQHYPKENANSEEWVSVLSKSVTWVQMHVTDERLLPNSFPSNEWRDAGDRFLPVKNAPQAAFSLISVKRLHWAHNWWWRNSFQGQLVLQYPKVIPIKMSHSDEH